MDGYLAPLWVPQVLPWTGAKAHKVVLVLPSAVAMVGVVRSLSLCADSGGEGVGGLRVFRGLGFAGFKL